MRAPRRLIPGWSIIGAIIAFPLFAAEPLCPPELPWDRFVTNRPRLFINAESLSAVTQAAVRVQSAWLSGMRGHVGRMASNANPQSGDYGAESAAAAFLFRCDGTSEWRGAATGLLERSVAYYRACDRDGRTAGHYSATRIQAITAYDWLYDAMSGEQRVRLGRELLAHVAHRVLDRAVPGDNLNDYRSGFYGELSLPWYIGIATRGTGIDEEKSRAAIAFGYEQHMRMLEHRRRLAGDDGGGATATLGYALRADPWAEFNFFRTLESAYGKGIATNWPNLALLPNYVLWNRLPNGMEFGAGDAFHAGNELPEEHLYTHLAQIRYFYGRSHPTQAALAAWLQGQCRLNGYNTAWPITPFLIGGLDQAPPAREPVWDSLPKARHFPGMGQVIMRSGWGVSDTVALFTAGGAYDWHKHFDENTFVIYHRGFLALDSGTRPEPGSHLFQYYCRTVAHNGILIRMEGERLPGYWGALAPGEPALPIANDGGMRTPTGAVIRAFCTTSNYTYIASDATACYHPDKCRQALRQFVHIQPNLFVVFDRVVSVKPEFRKTWLLHTAREPERRGEVFRVTQGEGRLFCRTLLPTNAIIETIGGPGREFWNDGWNRSLPPSSVTSVNLTSSETMGAWRVEVSPAEPASADAFLHLIEVGDRTNMIKVTSARLLDEGEWFGVEIGGAQSTVRVRFRKSGEPGGEIRFSAEGQSATWNLDNTVQLQSECDASAARPAPTAPTSIRASQP